MSEHTIQHINRRRRDALISADPGGGRPLGRAVSQIIRFSVASGGRLDIEGGLPSWVRSVQGRWEDSCRRSAYGGPLVVERLHEVLVTARGRSTCTGAGGPGVRRLPARWEAPAVTSLALIGGLGGSSGPACAG